MNGKRAKSVRRYARTACDASLTTMHVRSLKVPALLARDMRGEVIMQDAKPIVPVPEHKRYTAFWPAQSYRRIVREFKEGKRAGAPVPR